MGKNQKDPQIKLYKKGYLAKSIKLALAHTRRGDSFTLIGIPGVGKTDLLKALSKKHLLKELYPKESKGVIFILLDTTNLVAVTLLEFYRLLLDQLYTYAVTEVSEEGIKERVEQIYTNTISKQDSFLAYKGIKDVLNILVNESMLSVGIIIDDIEDLLGLDRNFFNSLKGVRAIDKRNISLIVCGDRLIPTHLTKGEQQKLKTLTNIFYNRVWLIPLNKEDASLVIETWKETDQVDKLCISKIEQVIELAGGHIWYMKTLCKILTSKPHLKKLKAQEELLEKLKDEDTIIDKGQQIWSNLTKEDRNILVDFIRNRNPEDYSQSQLYYLIQSDILDTRRKKLFSPLFEHFVQLQSDSVGKTKRGKSKEHDLFSIDKKTQQVLCDGKPLEGDLTTMEFKLMSHFIKHAGEVCSRDDVAEVMWGDQHTEKYSDWAIDRIISRIRKKIGENSRKPRHLTTLKGRGFRFVNSR